MPGKQLVIVGAGGLGGEVYEYALDTFTHGEYTIAGFLDDLRSDYPSAGLTRVPVLGSIADHFPGETEWFLIAIGDPVARYRVASKLRSRNARFATLVHPLAYVASSASIADGCIVAPFATIGARAQLEEFVHVHYYASAAHDSLIGAYVSLSPYAVANGGAQLAEGSFLGSRAIVNPKKRVGKYAKVTAGSVVYQDVAAGTIAHGNPAKVRHQLNGPVALQGSGLTPPNVLAEA